MKIDINQTMHMIQENPKPLIQDKKESLNSIGYKYQEIILDDLEDLDETQKNNNQYHMNAQERTINND